MKAPQRIAFVGGCQVVGLSETARHLLPDAHVEYYHVTSPQSGRETLDRIAGFDTVFTQFETEHSAMGVGLEQIQPLVRQALYLPIFRFTGLHPDMAYIFNQEGVVKGVAADYHSLIVTAAFALGLDEHRVERLFNPLVFAALGYFDTFAAARQVMETRSAEAGLDISGKFDAWLGETGQFMHTFNHPHICVLRDMAQIALEKAGLLAANTTVPDDIDDALARSFIAPVFPPLARRLNLKPGTTYLRAVDGGDDRELTLSRFISESYSLYRSFDPHLFEYGSLPEVRGHLARLLS